MQVDNFKEIRELLRFEKGYFYFAQIVARRKENPNLGVNSLTINHYFLDSEETWSQKVWRMVADCQAHNARAYLSLNKRSYQVVGLKTMTLIAELVKNGQYGAIKNSYVSACGTCNSDPRRTWMVDVDEGDEFDTEFLREYLLASLPTKNGKHLVVLPFDSRLAQPNIITKISRDAPVLAFCP